MSVKPKKGLPRTTGLVGISTPRLDLVWGIERTDRSGRFAEGKRRACFGDFPPL